MLLLLVVVQTTDAPDLTDALLQHGLRVTRIGSTGGWLGVGNVALMMGIEDDRYDDVMEAVAKTCHTRQEFMSTAAMVDPTLGYATMVEVEVGGAVVFGVPVERFVRIPGETEEGVGAGSGLDEEEKTMTAPTTRRLHESETQADMKLIVAVVKGEEVDKVVQSLVESDHRLTRINTTGGFLRRGNSTLLIGVPSNQVDDVVAAIRAACPPQVEAAPVDKGLPMYSATVFVLDSSHFARV